MASPAPLLLAAVGLADAGGQAAAGSGAAAGQAAGPAAGQAAGQAAMLGQSAFTWGGYAQAIGILFLLLGVLWLAVWLARRFGKFNFLPRPGRAAARRAGHGGPTAFGTAQRAYGGTLLE